MSYKFKWQDLYDHIAQRQLWLNVFSELIPNELGPALTKFTPSTYATAKTYCPCSSHGSSVPGKKKKDANSSGKAYGLLPRASETGGSVCNSCGAQPNGFSTIMFCTGWTFGQTVRAVAATRAVGWLKSNSNYSGPVKPLREWVAPEIDMEAENKKVERNKAIIEQCFKLDHPKAQLAQTYFQNRGIKNTQKFSGDVLFNPSLPYYCKLWDTANNCLAEGYTVLAKLPALVSKIRQPGGKFVNLHCTYFNHDGHKAKDFLWQEWCKRSGIDPNTVTPEFRKKYAPDVKKLRSRIEHLPIRGGGLHVCMPSELMGVSEGLENIASIIDDTPINCWGLLNAGMMRNWLPTNVTKSVVIFADHDPGGLKSAVFLRNRLQKMGLFVIIITPKMIDESLSDSVDWNDFYQIHGEGSLAYIFDDVFIEEMLAGTAEQPELPDWAFEK